MFHPSRRPANWPNGSAFLRLTWIGWRMCADWLLSNKVQNYAITFAIGNRAVVAAFAWSNLPNKS